MKSDLSCQIGGVQVTLSALSEDMKQLTTKVRAIEEEQVATNRRCEKLEEESHATSEKVRSLQARLLDAEQHSRAANLEVQGIPFTTGEDVYDVLCRVARAIGVGYNRGGISIAHRLRRYSKKLAHPPLIVQFLSRSDKESWIRAARSKRGLDASQISPSLQPSPVFLNDHLTSDNKALMGRARRLFREKKLVFASFTNGKVLVKRREGDEVIRVTDMEQLDVFDK